MTKKTVIDLASFCASCDIVQLPGEARMSIWDRADFGHAAFVTVPAVALSLLSGQDRTGQDNFPSFSETVARSLLCHQHRQPVRWALFAPSLIADGGKLCSVPRGDPRRGTCLLARTRAITSVLIYQIGKRVLALWESIGPWAWWKFDPMGAHLGTHHHCSPTRVPLWRAWGNSGCAFS